VTAFKNFLTHIDNVASKRFGLRINAGKTMVLCVGPETIFFVDETPLVNVDRFKYLGSFVSARIVK